MKKISCFIRFFRLKLLINPKKNGIMIKYNQEVIALFKRDGGNKENKKKEGGIVTKESICSTCALFSMLALLMLCTRTLIFGEIGRTVHIFLTGIFGYAAYPVLLGVFYLSVMGLLGKRLVKNRKTGAFVAFTLVCLSLVVHTALTYSWNMSGYVKGCFLAGEAFPDTTVCGALGGLAVYGVATLVSKVGAIILFSVLTVFFGYLCYISVKKGRAASVAPVGEESVEEEQPIVEEAAYSAPYAAPVAEQPRAIQQPSYGGQATQQPSYEEPINPYATPIMRQRPGVSLEDGSTQNKPSQGFSPFGAPQSENYGGRESLFGGTPAENYRKNLLFDPNSKVNQRPNVQPTQATVESSFTPSYTGAYENAVNESREEIRPTKIVSDRSRQSSYLNVEENGGTPFTPVQKTESTPIERPNFLREEPIAPVAPVQPVAPVEPEPIVRSTEFTREREEREFLATPQEERREEPLQDEGYRRHDYMDLFSSSNPNVFGNEEDSARMGRDFADRALNRSEERVEETREERRGDGYSLFDEEEDPYTLRSDFDTPRVSERESESRVEREETFDLRGREEEVLDEPIRGREAEEELPVRAEPVKPVEPPKPTPPPPPKPRVIRPYVRPRLDDFDCRDIEPTSNEEEVNQTKESIIATLEDFKITGASIASVTFGPTVTRYNVTLPRSVSPKKVVALDQSIAIDLHSNGVNIYPNYEDGVVSIEVPNKERQFVQLGCMLSGDTFVNAKSSSLMYAMGKDVANRKIYGDISKMIHLLVAGSSGSGKSVFLGSLIVSLIYKYSPEELRLILIDPKKTEFVLYNNLPHLMINEIITDAGKAVQSLNWAIGEMNRRYSLFESMSRSGKYVVNLDQYNEQLEKAERLPKIVIIIDELADLMLAAKKEMEDRIQNLTQKARAAGIHLIVATQRPSTDVITGVIKSNLATRVAFYVATDVDSRVILDQTGAQKLLGKGDFLYTMPGINVPVRVQSAFTSPEESQRIVNFIKQNNEAYYDEEATAFINSRGGNGGDPTDVAGDGGVDPMYIEALRYVIQSNSASISMIQRKCSAGYNRAGKIVEWMEDMGYISPFDGAKARKVLITKEEFESKYGPL